MLTSGLQKEVTAVGGWTILLRAVEAVQVRSGEVGKNGGTAASKGRGSGNSLATRAGSLNNPNILGRVIWLFTTWGRTRSDGLQYSSYYTP